MDETTQPFTEILVTLKCANNAPLDYRGRFFRMNEAIENAYEGMPCYVFETGKYYIFLRNAEGNLYPSDQFPDLALYAMKTEVTQEVNAAIAALINQSPATLDTLNELATALNNDPNFATTITNLIGQKVDKETGKSLMTDAERTKLANVETEANKYVHPASHTASMITEEANKRFMTDAERTKLGNLSETQQEYVHPASHAASMITEEVNKRFMTDAERTKLGNLSETQQEYVHPASHAASMITEEENKRFMTDAERTKLGKATEMKTERYNYDTNIDEIANTILEPGFYPLTQILATKADTFLIVLQDTYTDISRVTVQIAIECQTGLMKTRAIVRDLTRGITSILIWKQINYALSNTTPSALSSNASAGTSQYASRADHVHQRPALASPTNDGLMSVFDKMMLQAQRNTVTKNLTGAWQMNGYLLKEALCYVVNGNVSASPFPILTLPTSEDMNYTFGSNANGIEITLLRTDPTPYNVWISGSMYPAQYLQSSGGGWSVKLRFYNNTWIPLL